MGGRQRYGSTTLAIWHQKEMGGWLHTPAALPQGKTSTHCMEGWKGVGAAIIPHSEGKYGQKQHTLRIYRASVKA